MCAGVRKSGSPRISDTKSCPGPSTAISVRMELTAVGFSSAVREVALPVAFCMYNGLTMQDWVVNSPRLQTAFGLTDGVPSAGRYHNTSRVCRYTVPYRDRNDRIGFR